MLPIASLASEPTARPPAPPILPAIAPNAASPSACGIILLRSRAFTSPKSTPAISDGIALVIATIAAASRSLNPADNLSASSDGIAGNNFVISSFAGAGIQSIP